VVKHACLTTPAERQERFGAGVDPVRSRPGN
jgi:hypothetical protein